MSTPTLLEILTAAQAVGDLGPAPIAQHMEHAQRLARGLGGAPLSFLDLGTGAGVPGLVLLECWPNSTAVFVDASTARMQRLRERISALGWTERAEVVAERAEVVGRGVWRGSQDLVLSRAFGAPAVTAECATPLLRVGGRLLVSEPPEPDPDRWPATGLAELGLRRVDDVSGWAVLVAEIPVSERYPRRTGVPSRRPLW